MWGLFRFFPTITFCKKTVSNSKLKNSLKGFQRGFWCLCTVTKAKCVTTPELLVNEILAITFFEIYTGPYFAIRYDSMFTESPYLNKIVGFLFVWILIVSPLMRVLRLQWHTVVQTSDNEFPLTLTLNVQSQRQPSYQGFGSFATVVSDIAQTLNSLFERI